MSQTENLRYRFKQSRFEDPATTADRVKEACQDAIDTLDYSKEFEVVSASVIHNSDYIDVKIEQYTKAGGPHNIQTWPIGEPLLDIGLIITGVLAVGPLKNNRTTFRIWLKYLPGCDKSLTTDSKSKADYHLNARMRRLESETS